MGYYIVLRIHRKQIKSTESGMTKSNLIQITKTNLIQITKSNLNQS